jgi:hypothetical protein
VRGLIRTIALAGALVAAGAPAAQASTSPSDQKLTDAIFRDYVKDGTIDACEYTVEELQAAIDGVGPDIRQYASDFPAALRDALNARARGACEEPTPAPTAAPTPAPTVATGGTGGTVPPPPPSGPGAPPPLKIQRIVPEPPAPVAVASTPQSDGPDAALERAAATSPGNDAPVPLIGLGVLSALSLLTVMMLGMLKRLGSGEGRLAPAYHSWREVQWRAGGVWEDFRDWLSSGR